MRLNAFIWVRLNAFIRVRLNAFGVFPIPLFIRKVTYCSTLISFCHRWRLCSEAAVQVWPAGGRHRLRCRELVSFVNNQRTIAVSALVPTLPLVRFRVSSIGEGRGEGGGGGWLHAQKPSLITNRLVGCYCTFVGHNSPNSNTEPLVGLSFAQQVLYWFFPVTIRSYCRNLMTRQLDLSQCLWVWARSW